MMSITPWILRVCRMLTDCQYEHGSIYVIIIIYIGTIVKEQYLSFRDMIRQISHQRAQNGILLYKVDLRYEGRYT